MTNEEFLAFYEEVWCATFKGCRPDANGQGGMPPLKVQVLSDMLRPYTRAQAEAGIRRLCSREAGITFWPEPGPFLASVQMATGMGRDERFAKQPGEGPVHLGDVFTCLVCNGPQYYLFGRANGDSYNLCRACHEAIESGGMPWPDFDAYHRQAAAQQAERKARPPTKESAGAAAVFSKLLPLGVFGSPRQRYLVALENLLHAIQAQEDCSAILRRLAEASVELGYDDAHREKAVARIHALAQKPETPCNRVVIPELAAMVNAAEVQA